MLDFNWRGSGYMNKKIMLTVIVVCVTIILAGCKNGKPNVETNDSFNVSSRKW